MAPLPLAAQVSYGAVAPGTCVLPSVMYSCSVVGDAADTGIAGVGVVMPGAVDGLALAAPLGAVDGATPGAATAPGPATGGVDGLPPPPPLHAAKTALNAKTEATVVRT